MNSKDRARFQDKVRGCLVGSAIGDALGYAGGQVEFDSTITPLNKKVFKTTRPEHYSDDTQMTRAVFEGLIRGGHSGSMSTAAEEIAEEFIQWQKNPHEGSHRAPGGACMYGVGQLAKGTVWDKAGKPGGGGCGAAMRSAPYGLWHYAEPGEAARWAANHARMTHLHPMAAASAASVASGVAQCLKSDNLDSVWGTMISMSGQYDDEATRMLRNAITWAQNIADLGASLDALVLDKFRGWRGDEAAAASLYCFLRHPEDFQEAILLAVNSPGDSDSLGAITGALSGAWLGFDAIPEPWRHQVERAHELVALADRFVERRLDYGARLSETRPSDGR